MYPGQLPSPIELRIPADARLGRVLRLTAAGVAAGLGFDSDEIGDLSLAVHELFVAAVEGIDGDARYRRGGESITFDFRCRDGRLEVRAEGPESTIDLDALARVIVNAAVDDVQLGFGSRPLFHLSKTPRFGIAVR